MTVPVLLNYVFMISCLYAICICLEELRRNSFIGRKAWIVTVVSHGSSSLHVLWKIAEHQVNVFSFWRDVVAMKPLDFCSTEPLQKVVKLHIEKMVIVLRVKTVTYLHQRLNVYCTILALHMECIFLQKKKESSTMSSLGEMMQWKSITWRNMDEDRSQM